MPTPPSFTQSDVDYVSNNLGIIKYPKMAIERNLSLSCVKRLARDLKAEKLFPSNRTEPSEPNRTSVSEPNQVNRTEPIVNPLTGGVSGEPKAVENYILEKKKEIIEEHPELIETPTTKNIPFTRSESMPDIPFSKHLESQLSSNQDIQPLLDTIENLTKYIEDLDIVKEEIKTLKSYPIFSLSESKQIFTFNSFMEKVELSDSPTAKHLKSLLNVKGKHKRGNKERVIRIIRNVIDLINEL